MSRASQPTDGYPCGWRCWAMSSSSLLHRCIKWRMQLLLKLLFHKLNCESLPLKDSADEKSPPNESCSWPNTKTPFPEKCNTIKCNHIHQLHKMHAPTIFHRLSFAMLHFLPSIVFPAAKLMPLSAKCPFLYIFHSPPLFEFQVAHKNVQLPSFPVISVITFSPIFSNH